jgi:excisionase family DNA binding protein
VNPNVREVAMAGGMGPRSIPDRALPEDVGANERGGPSGQRPKLLLTPEEAAAMLSIGRTTVYELIAGGQLVSVRIGASRRIPGVALETFVSQLVQEAAADGEAT